MGRPDITPDSSFTAHARTLGIVAAWMTFIVTEIYAVVSGFAYVSQGAAVESGPFPSTMALLVVVMGPFLVLSILGGDRLKDVLRLVMILSGVLCLAGLAWLAVSPAQGIIIGILGWGAAGAVVFLLLAKVFGRVPVETGEGSTSDAPKVRDRLDRW
jgi:hypothetical protein